MQIRSHAPLRILTAVPLCDGHDSAVMTINVELTRAGMEIIYLGYHRGVQAIARAAVQEDVRAVGLSSYNGGHVEFFAAVRQALDARGGAEIGLFGGGGGTITRRDAALMRRQGTDRIFFAGERLDEIVRWIARTYRRSGLPPGPVSLSSPSPALPPGPVPPTSPSLAPPPGSDSHTTAKAITHHHAAADATLARCLTLLETREALRRERAAKGRGPAALRRRIEEIGELIADCKSQTANREWGTVVGVTGPGGAGKSTLIDELVRRYLERWPVERVAVLANDPSAEGPSGEGALLGDRATMIYCQDDRVFMRSLATHGASGGIAAAAPDAIEILRAHGFRWIFVETVGIGQDAVPFPPGMVDMLLLVMTPEYGGRLQLRKIAALRRADAVVLNKADRPAAPTARAELEARIAEIGRAQPVLPTVARRHRDPGVDAVFETLIHAAPPHLNTAADPASKQW